MNKNDSKMVEYKKCSCYKCGYIWESRAESPRCPDCGSRKIKNEDLEIPEYKNEKVFRKFAKIQEEQKIEETKEVVDPVETQEEDEEEILIYTCGNCKNEIKENQEYCFECGELIIWPSK